MVDVLLEVALVQPEEQAELQLAGVGLKLAVDQPELQLEGEQAEENLMVQLAEAELVVLVHSLCVAFFVPDSEFGVAHLPLYGVAVQQCAVDVPLFFVVPVHFPPDQCHSKAFPCAWPLPALTSEEAEQPLYAFVQA
jgi:intracellular sulfur oxidation DsrE/DsrF family protein